MTLVPDAAPLVAVADRRDSLNSSVAALLREEPGELGIPAPVTAEVDSLLRRRLGHSARRALLDNTTAGRFTVAGLEPEDHKVVADLERHYDDLDVGLADLSVLVVARRFRTRRILTFDQRHFRALRPLDGGRVTLLPSDATAGGAPAGATSKVRECCRTGGKSPNRTPGPRWWVRDPGAPDHSIESRQTMTLI